MLLDQRVLEQLTKTHEQQLANGQVFSRDELDRYYATFRDRFSPRVLSGLDGTELLEAMHLHGSRDSLVYWLEFKNDEELPSVRFGSIAGGSALKFGIYNRKETGQWMTGSPNAQRVISIEEAIAVARRNRDQFVAGVKVLDRLADKPASVDYVQLQAEMEHIAPDVNDSAWGHKYFHMMHPEILDDFHSPDYQRFHLIKLLQVPPEGRGRYVCAGVYAALRRQLELPMNQLTTAISERDGEPHRYWRVNTRSDEQERRAEWPAMRSENFVGIGWSELGDLSWVPYSNPGKEDLRKRIQSQDHTNTPHQIGRVLSQAFRFRHHVSIGDCVFAADGGTVLGIGRITGDYTYVDGEPLAHRRSVEWISTEEWKFPQTDGLWNSQMHEMKKSGNLVEAERRALDGKIYPPPPPPKGRTADQLEPLTGIPARIKAALDRKGQVILYGPPGTGKTHWAEHTACELASRSWFRRSHKDLTEEEKRQLPVQMCTFHPAYGYEDFLEGYHPDERDGRLVFRLEDGIFKRMCKDAADRADRDFFLVIDEINRGDIPRIFGELLTVLEKNKRGKAVTLPLSKTAFTVPPNVYVIGTMNTADRSIALLDTALRRRFAFVELMPDSGVLGETAVEGIPLGPWLDALNDRIREHLGRDARNLQVGHSYLMHDGTVVSDFPRFARVVRDDLIPLLEEYCYEDYRRLEQLLGSTLVDRERQSIRDELFDAKRRSHLVQALLEPCPEISTTQKAVEAEEAADEIEEEEEQDEEQQDEEDNERADADASDNP